MPTTTSASNGQPQQHTRSRSAVLKSFVTVGSKKTDSRNRNASKSPSILERKDSSASAESASAASHSPDKSYSKTPLGELNNLQGRRSPSKKQHKMDKVDDENTSPLKSLHKKNKSVVSLKSFTGKDKTKDKEKAQRVESTMTSDDGSPKKSKSSASLSAFFAKPKSSKENKKGSEALNNNREHRGPPRSAPDDTPPPIWAQFTTASLTGDISTAPRTPSNNTWDIINEIDRYDPQEYSPSKGRDFFYQQPTLARPKSDSINPTGVKTLTETFAKLRRTSTSSSSSSSSHKAKSPQKIDGDSKVIDSPHPRSFHQRVLSAASKKSENTDPRKPGSRVMAAVAVFNGKSRVAETASTPKHMPLDPVAIDKAFEAMLESRNTPSEVKEKMRRLDTAVKSEFIRQNKSSTNLSELGKESSRPGTGKRPRTDSIPSQDGLTEVTESPKKSRPRSLTFTLSKESSPTKKQKSGRLASHARTKSADVPRSSSSKSLRSDTSGLGFFNRAQKVAQPEDFVTYLRKVQKPDNIEIGKLQKLRQLLRNETVAWTDSFIVQGGMDEIVGLLYRIIDIEWREEHEDNLLHHSLNCLRALLTTNLALTSLARFEPTFFPAVLNLLFSTGDDKKGPAEFSTRNIIFGILFAYLTGSPTPERARTLLSYLSDPLPAESERPLNFIQSMHRPRPYKRWCTEVNNVTKEVFWIFLHSVNVIPYPSLPTTMAPGASFRGKWYPSIRPPVPAAPYVGGVEWDATTYIATHLDLLNGLLACLPTEEERNQVRLELRDSGWEKVMGGSLRTCKEKFYGGVHAGLGTYIGAGREDGWDVRTVREGPPRDKSASPRKSPKKKAAEPPKLDEIKVEPLPKLEIRNGGIGDWI